MTGLAGERLVLASASTSRLRVLRGAGLEVEADPAAIDEAEVKASFRADGASAEICAAALAEAKALRVSGRRPGALVIGADQMLVCDGEWFDKPESRKAARAQLQALRGKRHELLSAICAARNGGILWRHLDRPALTMRGFGDDFLEAYLDRAGEDVLGSVGAYRLEDVGAQLFARIEGDFFSILGLPLLPLLAFLRDHGALAK
jgi:septum formation protein